MLIKINIKPKSLFAQVKNNSKWFFYVYQTNEIIIFLKSFMNRF